MRLDLAEASWFGRERAVGYARLIALAFLPTLAVYYFRAMGPLGSDFLNFWGAGKLVLAGDPAGAYRAATMSAVQVGRDHWFPFVCPPPMLALVAPFGLLPYALALPAFVALTYAVWLAVARRLLPGGFWPIAAFPGAAVAAWHAQAGFITSALLMGGLLALKRRPYLAGALFGALIVKPHLALFVPLALIAGREWRAFVGAAVSALGLLAASALLFGLDTISAFLQTSGGLTAGLLTHGVDSPGFFTRMSTPFALLRALGATPIAAGAVQLALTLVLAVTVWRAWSTVDGDPLRRGAILVFATLLGSPYLFAYDMAMLIVPVCWLASEGMTKGFPRWGKAALAALYWTPLVGRAAAEPLGFNPTPLLLLGFLVLATSRLAPTPRPQLAAA